MSEATRTPSSAEVERVAKALFHARPIKVRGALGWGSMDDEDKMWWHALAIAALDMTHGAQLRMSGEGNAEGWV